MARIPDAFIDDLLARTDIVELVGSRVPLKKQGREYSARCPFHDERSPSFTVSPAKQFYHCFGCGAHGTAISFLMNYDRLEFLDAVEELAKTAGMDIPRDAQPQRDVDEGRDLYNALDAAMQFYKRQLVTDQKALDYLNQRGVDDATRERYMLGYAPEGYAGLKDALAIDERRLKLLERVGLLSKSDRGRVYDKFRDRLMFPIHDRRGRAIAFGGRVLGASSQGQDGAPKYLNSPETPLFHKGRELYGLWQVRQTHTKIPRLIVVEGYMDVIALAQHGVLEAVATLGTATTSDHAELLFRNAPDAFFCFDGDDAGRRAATRAMESVLPRMKDGRQAFFLFLPDGEDPDSLVRHEGAAGFDARLAHAMPLSQFFFETHGNDVNLATLDGKARLIERVKPLLAQIPDGAFGDLMQQRLTELTGLGARLSPTHSQTPNKRATTPAAPKRSLVRSAIALLLQQPALASSIPKPYLFAGLHQPGIELLVEMLDVVQQRPEIATGALLEHFETRGEFAALQKLASQPIPGDDAGWRADFIGAIEQLNVQTRHQRREELQTRLPKLDAAEKQELRELLQARTSGG